MIDCTCGQGGARGAGGVDPDCPLDGWHELPDGYVIEHHRMTDTVRFGPFATVEEAERFAAENSIGCNVKPMWLSVDWNRPG